MPTSAARPDKTRRTTVLARQMTEKQNGTSSSKTAVCVENFVTQPENSARCFCRRDAGCAKIFLRLKECRHADNGTPALVVFAHCPGSSCAHGQLRGRPSGDTGGNVSADRICAKKRRKRLYAAVYAAARTAPGAGVRHLSTQALAPCCPADGCSLNARRATCPCPCPASCLASCPASCPAHYPASWPTGHICSGPRTCPFQGTGRAAE